MKKIQLSIPEPCHENWDNMDTTEQGRYCNACAKEVIDFSDMSDSEVLNYFLKNKKAEKVCGRAYPDQLGRDITALPKKRKYWQWYYMLSAFLFLMKPAKTKAQGAFMVVADSSAPVFKIPLDGVNEQNKEQFIKAIIKDEEGNPVPYASVKIIGSDRGTSADEYGRFTLVKEEGMKLEISALGYETREMVFVELMLREIILKKAGNELKEVVVSNSCTLRGNMRIGGMTRGFRVRDNSFRDTVMQIFRSAFKIYPNPVTKGSNFNISIKLKQTGNFTIQIVDAAGRLISEQKINASIKNFNQQINTCSAWSGGVYYVKVLDDKGKLVNTGSLIVQ